MPLSNSKELRGLYLKKFDDEEGRMILAHLEQIASFASVGLAAQKNNALDIAFQAGKAWTVQYIKDIVSVGFDEDKGDTYGGPDD